MTLTAHGIVGGAIASVMPAHPLLSFCLAFGSHFLLDAVPHWDYPLHSDAMNPRFAAKMRCDRKLLTDMATIGSDGALGVLLAVVLFASRAKLAFVVGGACSAMFPDALQFVYMRLPREPLILLQRFHQWIHASKKITSPVLGVALQTAFIALIVVTIREATAPQKVVLLGVESVCSSCGARYPVVRAEVGSADKK